LKTKLPQYFSVQDNATQKNARKQHDANKLKQKLNFDERHKAAHKIVNIGDKVLIQQRKTTTKPPFDPLPYSVIDVQGNRVVAQRGKQVRKRDKNKLKVLKPRPKHLTPSWEESKANATSPYNDFDIEGVILQAPQTNHPPTPSQTLNEGTAQEAPEIQEDQPLDNLIPEAPCQSTTSEENTSDNTFSLTEEDEESMQALLSNAFKPTSSTRILRSSKQRLGWNPALNSTPAVISNTDERD